MSAQYPDVPALPGVPSLARLQSAAVVQAQATVSGETQALASALGLPTTVTFGTSALYSGLGLQPLTPQYGGPQSDNPDGFSPGALPLYGISIPGSSPDNTVNLAIQPDSVVEVDLGADSNINTHPVELGGFQSYNRVQDPISIRLLLACQGKNMTRQAFLSALENLREGTQIVTISTPDASYPNMVLKGYGYRKNSERGMVTIWADTQWLEERSTNVTVSAPPTSQPQGAATTNLGQLQPATPTPTQQAAISNPPYVPAPLPLYYTGTEPLSGDAF